MTMFRVSLLVVCLAAVSLFAQTPVEEPLAPAPVIELVPETEPSISERPLRIFADGAAQRARIATEAFGTNGALNDSTTGITLESFASTPNMFMKLGNSDGTAAFTVTNPGGGTLLKVRSDGSVALNYTGTNNSRLFVQHGTDNSNAIFVSHQPDVNANTTQYDKGLALQTTSNVHSGITNSGYLYGMHSWTYMGGTGVLSRLYGALIDVGFSALGAGGTVDHMYGLYLTSTAGTGSTVGNGYGLVVGNVLGTNDYGIFQTSSDDTNYFAGTTGIGTSAPLQKLHVFGGEDAGTIVQVENSSTGTGAHSGFKTVSTLSSTSYVAHGNRDASLVRFGIPLAGWGEIVNFNGTGFVMGTSLNTPVVLGTNNAERVRILGNGNVGIGTSAPTAKLHVNGNVLAGDAHFSGVVTGYRIQAHYQDVAEWVPATTDLTPGTVVTLNRARNNEVMASATAYDTSVAGVVSAQPGLILGIEGEGMEQIATTGRVKVRVDARQKPVGVGDLLVTSDIPGTAMRSEPMDFNGRKFHQPGTIIGKALEPLESGVGEILVLLSMQ